MKNMLKVIGAISILTFMFIGAFAFAVNLKKDIQHKKEMVELEKEKLRLEIKIKRIQLGYE